MYLFRNKTLSFDKNVLASLRSVSGMGWARVRLISFRAGITPYCAMGFVNEYSFAVLFALLRRSVVSEARIRRKVQVNINRLMDHGTYRGLRHKLSLPTRGQRTRTNAKTQKNKRLLVKKQRN